MRILVIGAGALGGYFGGRLLAAGRDVTFLVRPGRAKQLAATGGLVVTSDYGDLALSNPPLVRADGLKDPYDLILLSCKAFALESCMNDFAPAVGPDTMIVPVLNGMRHIDALKARFGDRTVLGGRAPPSIPRGASPISANCTPSTSANSAAACRRASKRSPPPPPTPASPPGRGRTSCRICGTNGS